MTINQWTNNYWSINCCLVPWGLAACCRCRGRGQCSQWQIINQWTNKPLSINQLLLPVTLRSGGSLAVRCRSRGRGRRDQLQSINEPTTISQSTAAWYLEGWRLVNGVEGDDSVANDNQSINELINHYQSINYYCLLPWGLAVHSRCWRRGRRNQQHSINELTTIGQSTAAGYRYLEGWRLVADI